MSIKKFLFLIIAGCLILSVNAQVKVKYRLHPLAPGEVRTGAEATGTYLPWLQGKRVAIVANQTSMIKNTHLVDSLLSLKVNIMKIFCPEHGFRGNYGAGEAVKSNIDAKTGLKIVSLYGKHKKPTPEDLADVDVVVFDIQDVGVRFYTYISTMHYVVEACAENNKEFIVLDRPNPNGFYVDGPVLEKELTSFVGMHPAPLVHGMTIAEYARMINGEHWLKDSMVCKLKYVPCKGYMHTHQYQAPVKPSPNLPNMAAIYLYPSLGLFEGTVVTVGRGTDKPFQIIGHPELKDGDITFTPQDIPGTATNPPHEGVECKGFDLAEFATDFIAKRPKIYLNWLMLTYQELPEKEKFFTPFFNKLAGNKTLQQQIISGVSEDEIRQSWQPQLEAFKEIRKKYLLYPDFE